MPDYKYTLEEVAAAIEEAGGILTDAARKLGCSRRTMTNYVFEYYPEELQKVRKEAEQRIIDDAKKTIWQCINEGDWRAAKYLLNSRAGWAQTTHVDVTSNGETVGQGMTDEQRREQAMELARMLRETETDDDE